MSISKQKSSQYLNLTSIISSKISSGKGSVVRVQALSTTPFFYKQSIFDPLSEIV